MINAEHRAVSEQEINEKTRIDWGSVCSPPMTNEIARAGMRKITIKTPDYLKGQMLIKDYGYYLGISTFSNKDGYYPVVIMEHEDGSMCMYDVGSCEFVDKFPVSQGKTK